MRVDSIRNREKIRNAAVQLLSQNDLETIPLDEIAKKASVTRVTLYNHYGSREELLAEIVLEAMDFLSSRFETLLDTPSPGWDDLMDSLFDLYGAHRQALELGGCRTLIHNDDVKESHKRFMGDFIRLLQRIRPEGFPLGQELTLGLISAVYIPVLEQVSGQDLEEKEKRDLFARIMKGALDL